jgi:hypothetical protein
MMRLGYLLALFVCTACAPQKSADDALVEDVNRGCDTDEACDALVETANARLQACLQSGGECSAYVEIVVAASYNQGVVRERLLKEEGQRIVTKWNGIRDRDRELFSAQCSSVENCDARIAKVSGMLRSLCNPAANECLKPLSVADKEEAGLRTICGPERGGCDELASVRSDAEKRREAIRDEVEQARILALQKEAAQRAAEVAKQERIEKRNRLAETATARSIISGYICYVNEKTQSDYGSLARENQIAARAGGFTDKVARYSLAESIQDSNDDLAHWRGVLAKIWKTTPMGCRGLRALTECFWSGGMKCDDQSLDKYESFQSERDVLETGDPAIQQSESSQ